MTKRRIFGYICVFLAFVLLVLAAAVPVYRRRVPDYDEKYDVIEGKDGFLFRARGADSDELGDFCGRNEYDPDTLSSTVAALSGRAEALREAGCESVFVLIPSKLCVYRDRLPENVARLYSADRKFTRLCFAMAEAGLRTVDLTERFSAIAGAEQIYHTCADEINEPGGFRLVEETAAALGFTAPAAEGYTLSVTRDGDAPLTREFRNETGKTVLNRTLTLKENSAAYTDGPVVYDSVTSTENPGMSGSLIVFDTGSAGACRKFFSASFGLCVFVDGVSSDEAVISRANPGAAVFLIYEGDLGSLPKKPAQPEIHGEASASPVIDEVVYSDSDRAVIFGRAEAESLITVTGGTAAATVRTDGGAFAAEVTISSDAAESVLTVTAKTDGKDESDPVSVTAVYDPGRGYKSVRIGKLGHLHFEETVPDFTGATAMPDDELYAYVNYLRAKADRIRSVSPGTKIIYVIPPNHLTIYPETAPDGLEKGSSSRLQQFIDAFKDDDRIIFLDLPSALTAAKQTAPFRIYNKTDTHWNELGAYYAYAEIMKVIAADFPSAAPDPLSAFDVYTRSVRGGDMANFLNADLDAVREDGVYVRSKKPLQSGINKDHSMNFENAWFSDQHEFEINDASLPTMIMYRDSFSTNLMSFMAEKFSKSVFHTMWDYPEEYDLWAEMKPDYIIIERVERSLGGI